MLDTTQTVVSLSREDLYEQVWTTPMRTLAGTYGFSDVGLAKMCGRLRIPTPPVGYWQKKRNGKSVRRIPLPVLDEAEEKQIRIELAEPAAPGQTLTEVERLIKAEKADQNRIEVPKALVEPHAVVERTERSLRGAKQDEHGLVCPRAKNCFSVTVSRDQIDRAMRIMDSLAKALEARGYEVLPTDEPGQPTKVSVREELVTIGLAEILDRRGRPLSAAQKKERERYSWMASRTEYDYFPSGRLALTIGNGGGRDFTRHQWCDGVKQKVERCLNGFIAGVIKTSEDIKVARAEREARERKWQEEERRRKEAEQRRREEEARIADLDEKVTAWARSQQMRAFLAAVRATMIERHGEIIADSDLAHWLAWAERRADGIDPIVCGQSFTMKVEPRPAYASAGWSPASRVW